MSEIKEKIFGKSNRGVTEIYTEYKGYVCIVFALNSGYRCGYVLIPETHQLYTKEHIDLECHGGITFNKVFEGGEHVIGFDCAHLGDSPDISIMSETHIKTYQMFNSIFDGLCEDGSTIKTKEYVFENCKNMVEQLIKLENNNE